jgi:hypothetical protein
MSGSLKAYIAEPLTAWACYCFLGEFGSVNSSRLRNFRDNGYPIDEEMLESMGKVSILPTTCGLLIEKYLILYHCRFFEV